MKNRAFIHKRQTPLVNLYKYICVPIHTQNIILFEQYNGMAARSFIIITLYAHKRFFFFLYILIPMNRYY